MLNEFVANRLVLIVIEIDKKQEVLPVFSKWLEIKQRSHNGMRVDVNAFRRRNIQELPYEVWHVIMRYLAYSRVAMPGFTVTCHSRQRQAQIARTEGSPSTRVMAFI